MSVTLTAAVRSNLLSLQNTASLLDTTQTRLATGNKVNSALDNPTNFFTAQGLNSRASDLGQLLDSVSNAVQTIAAANNGITSITKLVESAQATARQALQTAATVDSTSGATLVSLATAATSDTTSLTIAADVSVSLATQATSDTTSVVIADPVIEVDAAQTTGDLSSLNATGGTITINGQNVVVGAADGNAAVLAALQGAATAGGFSVVDNGGANGITITSDNGTDLVIGGDSTTLTELGLTAGTTNGTPPQAGTSGTITINGQNVVLADGDNAAAILAAIQAAATASSGANAFTVSNASGVLTLTGTAGNDVVLGGNAATLTALGLTSGTTNGTPAVDNSAGNLTVNGQTIALADGDDSAAILTKLQAAATASTGTNAFTVSNASGVFTITGTAGNDVVIGGDAATVSALGLTAGTVDGTPASAGTTTQIANPKRADLVTQYNDLLTQIDQLTKDSSFNGVNLLGSDNLSVLFNEDGSSKLDITGASSNSAGLGLTSLASTAFDTNTSINSTLNDLKASIDTLRSQASKFGSNLSVVQTRQDFTKAIINTLQTGASNLTLADSNEEAANLLALQTRQSLSTKALALASQSDQNVLRLLQ